MGIAFVCYFTAILQPKPLALVVKSSAGEVDVQRLLTPAGRRGGVILVNPGISGVFLKTGSGTPLGVASLNLNLTRISRQAWAGPGAGPRLPLTRYFYQTEKMRS